MHGGEQFGCYGGGLFHRAEGGYGNINQYTPSAQAQEDDPGTSVGQATAGTCTICEKNGRCRLQELANRFGVTRLRFQTASEEPSPDESSPCITVDKGKCILCGDCVRMCEEVQNIGALCFHKQGFQDDAWNQKWRFFVRFRLCGLRTMRRCLSHRSHRGEKRQGAGLGGYRRPGSKGNCPDCTRCACGGGRGIGMSLFGKRDG